LNPVVLIALGNTLMSDEGIGVRILEALLERGTPPGVDLLDSGNSGMRILHALEGRQKAVFVDCAFMDSPPGTLRRFTPDEVETRKALPRLSLHEGDLMQTLELALRLGTLPGKTVLFGIEPKSVEPGDGVTPELAGNLDRYVRAVLDELERKP
jgi:hydrogenase maturation protease